MRVDDIHDTWWAGCECGSTKVVARHMWAPNGWGLACENGHQIVAELSNTVIFLYVDPMKGFEDEGWLADRTRAADSRDDLSGVQQPEDRAEPEPKYQDGKGPYHPHLC